MRWKVYKFPAFQNPILYLWWKVYNFYSFKIPFYICDENYRISLYRIIIFQNPFLYFWWKAQFLLFQNPFSYFRLKVYDLLLQNSYISKSLLICVMKSIQFPFTEFLSFKIPSYICDEKYTSSQKALFKVPKICNIIFWIENDPPRPLALFQKFIRFDCGILP